MNNEDLSNNNGTTRKLTEGTTRSVRHIYDLPRDVFRGTVYDEKRTRSTLTPVLQRLYGLLYFTVQGDSHFNFDQCFRVFLCVV